MEMHNKKGKSRQPETQDTFQGKYTEPFGWSKLIVIRRHWTGGQRKGSKSISP